MVKYSALIPAGVFVVGFVFLAVLFPDAPIRKQGEAFVGKYGAEHTSEHYRAYLVVSALSVAAFLTAFFGCIWQMTRSRSQEIVKK